MKRRPDTACTDCVEERLACSAACTVYVGKRADQTCASYDKYCLYGLLGRSPSLLLVLCTVVKVRPGFSLTQYCLYRLLQKEGQLYTIPAVCALEQRLTLHYTCSVYLSKKSKSALYLLYILRKKGQLYTIPAVCTSEERPTLHNTFSVY